MRRKDVIHRAYEGHEVAVLGSGVHAAEVENVVGACPKAIAIAHPTREDERTAEGPSQGQCIAQLGDVGRERSQMHVDIRAWYATALGSGWHRLVGAPQTSFTKALCLGDPVVVVERVGGVHGIWRKAYVLLRSRRCGKRPARHWPFVGMLYKVGMAMHEEIKWQSAQRHVAIRSQQT
eukprot:scaffold166462_cov30-Tisochrysis_lutea.AAC.6